MILNADPSDSISAPAVDQTVEMNNDDDSDLRINEVNIDVYIAHRRERHSRINSELKVFSWINFVYLLFFAIYLG